MTKIGKGLLGGALGRRDFLQATGFGLAAPMLMGLPDFANAQEKVELTMWAWTSDTQIQADMFSKKFPNITVKVENVGQGAPHYVKLRNALQAGSGLPDLAQMEFNSVLSFKQLGALADIGAGVNASKDKFIDWTWKAVSDGDKVYGVPWDSGPMGVLYRGDIFDKYKITPPDTWDAFAESAVKLAKDAPGIYLTDFGAADPGWVVVLLWQAGWRPFLLSLESGKHPPFREQAALLAKTVSPNSPPLSIPGANHMSIVRDMGDIGSPLGQIFLRFLETAASAA